MQCPKCQFDHKLQTTECLKCGIAFSRYLAAQEAAAKKFILPAPKVRSAEPQYWYAARTHSWPRYRRPLTWEGVLVDIALAASFGGIRVFVNDRVHPLLFFGFVIGILALYAATVHSKGEPNRKNWDD